MRFSKFYFFIIQWRTDRLYSCYSNKESPWFTVIGVNSPVMTWWFTGDQRESRWLSPEKKNMFGESRVSVMVLNQVITITHENEKNKGDSGWFRVMDITLNGDTTHHPLSDDITWYIVMSNLVKKSMKSCAKYSFSVQLQFFLHLENHVGPNSALSICIKINKLKCCIS